MLSPTEPSGRFPHLHGRGTIYDTHGFEWTFLLKFLCTKIVQQFVFLVQSIVLVIYFYSHFLRFKEFDFGATDLRSIRIRFLLYSNPKHNSGANNKFV